MSPDIVSVAVLLFLCVCVAAGATLSETLEVKAVFGADCSLECTAQYKAGLQYSAVRWYKEGDSASSRLSGLLTKDLPDGPTQLYGGVERHVELLAGGRDLLLPNVTCADGGVYTCHLAAPVGEQNREGRVLLVLTDCPDAPTETLMTDTYLNILATAVLLLALVTFLVSYSSLKTILRDRSRTTKPQSLLNAALRPLDEKDLKSIYTLGPKAPPAAKRVCV